MVLHPRDLDLVQRCLAGESAARTALGERFRCIPRIVAALNRRLVPPLPPDRQDDVAGEASLTAWNKLRDYNGCSALESWLFRFCEFTLMNHRRRSQRERAKSHNPDPVDPAAFQGHADVELVRMAIERLTQEEQAIVQAKHFEALTFDRIAEQLGVPLATAKGRYYRAISRLRLWLDAREGGS